MRDDNVQADSQSQAQALAICNSIFDRERAVSTNDKLLDLVKGRRSRRTEFNYGISTADRYVKTLKECVGVDVCYRFACSRRESFNDALEKATRTLVYSNPDMELEEKLDIGNSVEMWSGTEIELPKNTLMAFRHRLTTPRKDRDGDILRTQGASVDPRMLLLWQHVHTLPIGKMVAVAEHNSDKLSLVSAIVDVNELSHDAAVMIDNGMGRFSHGFKALEFEEMKDEDGGKDVIGFDIKKFEIMEASLVSVPSNVDAEVEEVMLSLIDGSKLKSPLMKAYGKSLQAKRPLALAINYKEDFGSFTRTIETQNAAEFEKVYGIITKEEGTEDESEDAAEEERGEGERDTSCSSKEAEGTGAEKENEAGAGDKEVATDEKAGRAMSAKNLQIIKDIREDVIELGTREENMTRGGVAICERCVKKLDDLISSVEDEESHETSFEAVQEKEVSVKEAMTVIVASASAEERKQLESLLVILREGEQREAKANQYREVLTG